MKLEISHIRNSLHGHLWTLAPYFTGVLPRKIDAHIQEILHPITTAEGDSFLINGYLYQPHITTVSDSFLPKSSSISMSHNTLVILLPGVASHPQAVYYTPWIQYFLKLGYDILSMSLRGSTGYGYDYYHAGLTQDIHEVLKLDMYAHYQKVIVMGASLGGQIVASFACETISPRVKAIITLSPPIDMLHAQQNLDKKRHAAYRHAILTRLKLRCFRLLSNAKAEHYHLPFTHTSLMKIRSFYEWDKHLILPRFKFQSVMEYYQKVSVLPKLDQIKTPTFMLFNAHDPIVPCDKIYSYSQTNPISPHLKLLFNTEGGHLSFPFNWRLHSEQEQSIIKQVHHWLSEHL
jgi:uncharacterized protein